MADPNDSNNGNGSNTDAGDHEDNLDRAEDDTLIAWEDDSDDANEQN